MLSVTPPDHFPKKRHAMTMHENTTLSHRRETALRDLMRLCGQAPSAADKDAVAEVITECARDFLTEPGGEQLLVEYLNATRDPFVATALRQALHR